MVSTRTEAGPTAAVPIKRRSSALAGCLALALAAGCQPASQQGEPTVQQESRSAAQQQASRTPPPTSPATPPKPSAPSVPGQPQATLVRARLVPFRTAQGLAAQMVIVDWKNTGNTPIRAVHATMTPYDAAGRPLTNGAKDYTIYATFTNESPGIAPGETYVEPEDEGFVLTPGAGNREAVRVDVTITRAMEKVAEY